MKAGLHPARSTGRPRPMRLACAGLWLCLGLAGCASAPAVDGDGDGSARVVTRTSNATVWATPEAAQAAAAAAATPARPAAGRPQGAAPAGGAAAGAGSGPRALAAGQTAAGASFASTPAAAAGLNGSAAAAATRPSPALAGALSQTLYFDFDHFDIRDEFKPLLDGHAQALVADRSLELVVEGHADERGSTEYNLALGQKRAHAVVKALVLLGAANTQLEAVSFGDTRPAVARSNEEAWARNRRAEIKRR